MADARVAFVDESHRQLPSGKVGTLLAAAVIREADESTVAGRARGQLAGGQLRYHWRDEGRRSRERFVAAFTDADGPDMELVVVATIVDRPRRIERGRVDNLWRLGSALGARDVGRLVLESRQERNDRRDRRELERARGAGACPAELVYSHLRRLRGPVRRRHDLVDTMDGLARDARHRPRTSPLKAPGPGSRLPAGFPGLTSMGGPPMTRSSCPSAR